MESNKDKLEEFFRRTLDGLDDQPAGNGWDIPSGKVWEGIEAGMDNGGSARKPGFVKYGLITLVVLLLSVIAYQWWTFDEKVEDLTKQVHQHVATIERLQKDLNEKEVEFTANVDIDNQSIENRADDSSSSQVSASDKAVAKNLNNQKNGASSANSTFEKVAINTSDSEFSSEIANGAASNNDWNNITSGTADASPQNAAVSTNPPEFQSSIARMETSASGVQITNPVIGVLSAKWPELKAVSPPLVLTTNPFVTPQTAPLTLSAYFSPAYSWRTVRNKMTDVSTPFEKTESPKLSYTAGVLAGVDVSKRWRFYSGINYQRFYQTSKHTVGLRYTTDQAVTDQNGNVVSTYQTNLQTSFGDAEVELRVANSGSSTEPEINEGHIFPVRFMAEERLEHLGIPVLLGYRIGSERLTFTLKGGVVGSFLLTKEMHITHVRMMHPRLVSRQVDIPGTKFLKNINSFTLDAQLSAGVHVGLSKRLSLTLEPALRSNITPIFENEKIETRMFSLALNTGLSVRL